MGFSKTLHSLRRLVRVFILLACAGMVSGGLTACDRSPGPEARQQPPPPPVSIMLIEPSDTAIYRDYPARIHGARTVQVRARVGGILEKRRYEEGQVVAKDDILFEIDPEPYEIALRRAEADFDDADAQYRHAEKQWTRYSSLYAQDAISEREHDLAETDYFLARARKDRADAARADARRNLRYASVVAPVAGVTDMESVSEGNLIESGRLLTTIIQQDPVHVRFSIPENDALIQRAAREALVREEKKGRRYDALLIMPDGTEYDKKGEVDFTASTINPATGSVMARAVFTNLDNILIPGQFVRIRVRLEELTDIVLIPETAVIRGREGTRVFVVDGNDIAKARSVRTGPVVNGRQVILEGLDKGEKLVVNGHVALQDNMKVTVSSTVSGPVGGSATKGGR